MKERKRVRTTIVNYRLVLLGDHERALHHTVSYGQKDLDTVKALIGGIPGIVFCDVSEYCITFRAGQAFNADLVTVEVVRLFKQLILVPHLFSETKIKFVRLETR